MPLAQPNRAVLTEDWQTTESMVPLCYSNVRLPVLPSSLMDSTFP